MSNTRCCIDERLTQALGVDAQLLRATGAVTAEVARQMAQGALQRGAADLALSITGVLGPDPDEDGNQPGLVYFAVARRGRATREVRNDFPSEDPDRVRQQAVFTALELLREAAEME